MGLFDKLIKNVADEVTSKIKSELKEEIEKRLDIDLDHKNNQAEISAVSNAVSAIYDEQKEYNTGDEYFAALITEDKFPGYTIEKNVHPNVFDGNAHPKCYPISYLFKNDGKPTLAVLVMNRNQYRAMIAVGTYQILDNEGINYIRFYKGMENAEAYVIGRIKENL